MRIPIKLDKQGNPTLANDSSMSFQLSRKKAPAVPCAPVPAVAPLVCVNQPISMLRTIYVNDEANLLTVYSDVVSVDPDTGAIELNFTSSPAVVPIDPAAGTAPRIFLFLVELVANWCDQYGDPGVYFTFDAVTDTSLTNAAVMQHYGANTMLFAIRDPAIGDAFRLTITSNYSGVDHAWPTVGIDFNAP